MLTFFWGPVLYFQLPAWHYQWCILLALGPNQIIISFAPQFLTVYHLSPNCSCLKPCLYFPYLLCSSNLLGRPLSSCCIFSATRISCSLCPGPRLSLYTCSPSCYTCHKGRPNQCRSSRPHKSHSLATVQIHDRWQSYLFKKLHKFKY